MAIITSPLAKAQFVLGAASWAIRSPTTPILFRGGSVGSVLMRPRKNRHLQPAATGQEQSRVTCCDHSRLPRHAEFRSGLNELICMHVSLPSISLITFASGLGATAAPLRLCQPTSSAPLTRGRWTPRFSQAPRASCLLACFAVPGLFGELTTSYSSASGRGWSGERWDKVARVFSCLIEWPASCVGD